ncbi:DNA alkylation repair protein [uncultured Corynebacterium sp.]|uniref:DNA alkylation repair protein n=1 Tax=uncultured Corynebacterium sp. TaxID=159447 RepID=UPI0025E5A6E8|nr:DNA alkylation repair protein [uncultured Corynebacterium sp.]
MTFAEVQAALAPLADAARAEGQSAYLRGQFPFLGVATPDRRRVVAPLLARRSLDWPLVWECWDAPEREYQYVACDHLRRIKAFPAAHLGDLHTLVTTKSWWDTVDSLAKVAGSALPNPTAGAVMDKWMTDPSLWVRRVSIICQLGKGTATDTRRLTRAIEANLESREFFITKAIGWALRDYFRHDPEWVRAFVDGHDLAPLSRREALKHADI